MKKKKTTPVEGATELTDDELGQVAGGLVVAHAVETLRGPVVDPSVEYIFEPGDGDDVPLPDCEFLSE